MSIGVCMEKAIISDMRLYRHGDFQIVHTVEVLPDKCYGARLNAKWTLYREGEVVQELNRIPIRNLWEMAEYIDDLKDNPFPMRIDFGDEEGLDGR